ncbi:conserved hypothetical protein [uncultured Eubacteriales bacterium]|uniref:DNA-binding protein n=1 Tax=uncultured Eubacteriales bacterium TaxID=172733 RepID=A0A212JME3_9FIRM|nr:conserved hypothetical protein [uncultured Eubacteriales bacterium]
MDDMSAVKAVAPWGISARMINYHCVDRRILGAQKVGATWIIPKDAPRPEDRRKKGNRKNSGPGGHGDAQTKDI